jgi:hypothetical protein
VTLKPRRGFTYFCISSSSAHARIPLLSHTTGPFLNGLNVGTNLFRYHSGSFKGSKLAAEPLVWAA